MPYQPVFGPGPFARQPWPFIGNSARLSHSTVFTSRPPARYCRGSPDKQNDGCNGDAMQLNQEHREIARTLKRFIDNEINPHVDEWEKKEIFPAWRERQPVIARHTGVNPT
jgi:hypothetical protein